MLLWFFPFCKGRSGGVEGFYLPLPLLTKEGKSFEDGHDSSDMVTS